MVGMACLALTGCGEDPVIVDAETTGKTEVGGDGEAVVIHDPDQMERERPSLPGLVLEEPYAQYLKEAVDSRELHLGIHREGVKVDPLSLVFSAAKPEATLFFRGTEETPFKGWAKHWHDNGALGMLTHFKNGQQDGLALSWYNDGQLQIQGYYSEGAEDDEWVFWDRDGNETKRETFENGRRVEK